jgi:UDP-N-acetylmuramate dehydrogenase
MIRQNVSLKNYNTFGLNYASEFFIAVKSESELIKIFKDGISVKKPILILGGGSNILFTSDFRGTVIHPEISGINIEKNDTDHLIVSSGAGVSWDSFVEWAVSKGLGGVENLSHIPGSAGAAPVQNIGAYGADAKDSIVKVRAVCVEDGSVIELDNNECRFGYRSSIFKNEMKGRCVVTRVYFKLALRPSLNLIYGSLGDEVNRLGGATLINIRNAVINIRRSKLPDPEKTGNAGSFFKNPVVDANTAKMLKEKYPLLPLYEDQSGGFKVAAGWLIEACGLKGKRTGDAGIHDKQALVIVNYGGASGKEIFNLSEEVKKSVMEKFSIHLEREVEVIGTT